ncbi:exonuclease domain-containing protein [Nicoliella lavandulae]|uniref:Exonuclease domain-containing protein n=1 Tax=Nicoliella lavandulae TaxID=3082954 RepID=A0ABU8SL30_9LACO
MNSNTVFSVVDLETTGNSIHEDNRIIQFSCALVQNNKIIRVYSTNVNSETEVPARITKLTGITNDEIKSAPTFKQIANKLYKLLSGTVFVAHNVNFDFPFLNHEFQRVGHAQLNIKAIDTVTLSQILLPMVPSFRLRDLTSYFNIKHDHPHSASSDAIATAHLFLILVKRMKTLPTPTLKSILGLQLQLPLNTGQLVQSIFQEQVHANRKLPAHLMYRHGLVLRRFTRQKRDGDKAVYPYPFSNHEKQMEFSTQIRFIPEQVKLMNTLYDNYQAHQPDNLLVATNKGMGKKFGYGLPMAYLSHNRNQKVIISLGNRDNELDFVNKTIPVIKQLAPFNVSYSILKSANNYIDLNRFFVSLRTDKRSVQIQFIKAQILVWLTMTKTGDLGELNLSNQSPYCNEINHQGVKSIRPTQPFYRVDFLKRARNSNKYSNFLITTHDYLLRHAKQISQQNQKPLLVIDNALELNDSVMRMNHITLELNHVNVLIRKIQGIINNTHTLSLNDILGHQKQFRKSVERVSSDLNAISAFLEPIQKRISTRFLGREFERPNDKHLTGLVDVGKLRDEYNFEKQRFNQIKAKWKACFENANRIVSGPNHGYSLKEQAVVDHFQALVLEMTREIKQYHEFTERLKQQSDDLIVSVYANQVHDLNNAFLTAETLSPRLDLSQSLFKHFPAALLVDNLNIDSRIRKFTFDQLGMQMPNKRLVQIEQLMKRQSLSVVDDGPMLNATYDSKPVDYFAEVIVKALKHGTNQNYFLFNSKQLLRQVYFALTERHINDHYNVMAEGISGNQSKLIKNILNDGQLTVLGTIATLETSREIAKQPQSIFIVDLPILLGDSPKQRLLLSQVNNLDGDSFKDFIVPNAILKLNQALALTNPNQWLAILDSRLVNTDYGRQIATSLTSQFALERMPTRRINFATANFFKNFIKK